MQSPLYLFSLLFVVHVGRQVHGAPDGDVEDTMIAEDEARPVLPDAPRYPPINSGDKIALKMSYTSGDLSKFWMKCSDRECSAHKCAEGRLNMKSSKWSSCVTLMYIIRAIGKSDGQPINSGDKVTISSAQDMNSKHIGCDSKDSYKCRFQSIAYRKFKDDWFRHSQAIFQIFSRDGEDGTPVEYGDIVGFRYPYYYADHWLSYKDGHWFAHKCSNKAKSTCAKINSPTGFQIFKPYKA
ncbi:predicted protein [Nematostella vectensis]|uniref:Uncharacterized protein n=1 Tax=Nematostella vectensis TaxID=45351 RepID=A7RLP7_NEMVE|nr:predicted protein [Nematostella vectensis]|eukprot:XP_001639704.1 predicted protein [Nematostella vectensis]